MRITGAVPIGRRRHFQNICHTHYIYTHTYISPCVASYNYVTIIYEEAMQRKHICVCACLETHDEQLVCILLKLIFAKRAKTTTPFAATISCCAATCAPFVSRSLPRVGGGGGCFIC